MKTMKIYEPAMCCPTGLCGVGVDPELLRISTVLNTLTQSGVEVQRFNMASAPVEFVKSKAVAEYLQKFGPEKLPVVTVEDIIVITGRYPTNAEFTSWLDLSEDVLGVQSCEGESSCCCGSEGGPEAESCCGGGSDNAAESCCGDALPTEGCCTPNRRADAPASDGCCSVSCC